MYEKKQKYLTIIDRKIIIWFMKHNYHQIENMF
jgi:hypothetical protein